jgi:hypothetical protein
MPVAFEACTGDYNIHYKPNVSIYNGVSEHYDDYPPVAVEENESHDDLHDDSVDSLSAALHHLEYAYETENYDDAYEDIKDHYYMDMMDMYDGHDGGPYENDEHEDAAHDHDPYEIDAHEHDTYEDDDP